MTFLNEDRGFGIEKSYGIKDSICCNGVHDSSAAETSQICKCDAMDHCAHTAFDEQ